MLRKLFSCAAIALLSVAAPALAQTYGQGAQTYDDTQPLSQGPYSRSPAHEAEVQRGAPIVDALNLLEAQGYASFSNVQDMGGGKFAADAVKDGQAQHVIIESGTRQISVAGPAQNMPQTMTGGAR